MRRGCILVQCLQQGLRDLAIRRDYVLVYVISTLCGTCVLILLTGTGRRGPVAGMGDQEEKGEAGDQADRECARLESRD